MNVDKNYLYDQLMIKYIESFIPECTEYLKQFKDTDVIICTNRNCYTHKLKSVINNNNSIYLEYSKRIKTDTIPPRYKSNNVYLCNDKIIFSNTTCNFDSRITDKFQSYIKPYGSHNINTFKKIIGYDIDGYLDKLSQIWLDNHFVNMVKFNIEYGDINKELFKQCNEELSKIIHQHNPLFDIDSVPSQDLAVNTQMYWDKIDKAYFHKDMVKLLEGELFKLKPYNSRKPECFKLVNAILNENDSVSATLVKCDASDKIIAALSYNNDMEFPDNRTLYVLSRNEKYILDTPLKYNSDAKDTIECVLPAPRITNTIINISSNIPNFNLRKYKYNIQNNQASHPMLVVNEERMLRQKYMTIMEEKIKAIKRQMYAKYEKLNQQ